MAQVFISYARSEEKVARRVAAKLKEADFDVWWDADLPAHRSYSEVIEKHLKDAPAVVVLWSKSAAKSQWVRAEADYARSEGKLVQAQLDAQLPPMPFNQIQCANLAGWRGSDRHPGWSKLRDSVAALVAGEDLPASPTEPSAKWWQVRRYQWIGAGAVLLLLAAAWLLPAWMTSNGGERPVVAVLPFESLDERDSSLVLGIWEDTRNALSRNPQLLVLGPNTSEELAKKDTKAVRNAADYVVRANVRSVGNRIRVSANLVRTKDDAQVWSERFDRKLDDVFALQGEIARDIEGRIRGRLAKKGGIMPENIATTGEVYALYSDARAKIRKRQLHLFEEAERQLEQVVEKDPNFAPGWATLAVVRKMAGLAPSSGRPEQLARRAITLAPNLAAGHAALGFTLESGPTAQAALRKALAIDPNDIEAMNWLANSLDRSKTDERLQLYSRIVELEPLWWPAILNKLGLLTEKGDRAAAQAELQRVERIGDNSIAALIKIHLATRSGDLSSAVNIGLAEYARSAGFQQSENRNLMNLMLWEPLMQLGYFAEADQIFPPPPPSRAYIPLIRENDPRALDIVEARMKPRQFWEFGPLPIVLARVYLLNGQGPRLAQRYRDVAKSPAEFEQVVGPGRLPDIAPSVALALKGAGDPDQAAALLTLAESRLPKATLGASEKIQLARIFAVQGRTEEAMSLLSDAIKDGWLPPYMPVHTDIALDPPLAELKVDPRFQKLRQQILGHLEKERAELGTINLPKAAIS
ncbi:TIR domain-containing protein [Sphingomonas edaphi]|uniref:TIR domain-containing protein n=1 Tax=Sphingomonas edaphi TaxID=2315689 RepID=UPI001313EF07|nr:TIR domain-containing protein [Sphingomonas edaphi]